jgi:hypothetical protein
MACIDYKMYRNDKHKRERGKLTDQPAMEDDQLLFSRYLCVPASRTTSPRMGAGERWEEAERSSLPDLHFLITI